MDYGFTLVPVTMLFLYHSGAVTIRFTLLDNRAIAIPITIMAFANSHASAYGTNSNSNIVRQSWRRDGSYGSNHQNVLHSNFLHCEPQNLTKPVVESSLNLIELQLEPLSVGRFLRGERSTGSRLPSRDVRDPVGTGAASTR
jgi:hypothetical protein